MVPQFDHSFNVPLTCEPDAIQVSVIIPAFDAALTIARAIASVRAQRIGGIEIIVINDGSRDNTAEEVQRVIAAGENIILLQLANNRGVSAARNAGIAIARGKYLAFLDADDIWLPEKLAKQIPVMEADPVITLVSCNSQMMSAEGVALKEGHLNRPPVEGVNAWKTLLVYNFLPTPTVLARTKQVRQLGGFDESLAVGEDLDLWIKLGVRGTIVTLPDILINYYDFSNSLMKRNRGKVGSIVVPMLEKHIREQTDKLSAAEIRHIRGQRSFQIGCDMFFTKNYHTSIPFFIRSIVYGTRTLKSVFYVPRAIVMAFFLHAKRAFNNP